MLPSVYRGAPISKIEVIDFYDARFGIGFTQQKKVDLSAFLRTR